MLHTLSEAIIINLHMLSEAIIINLHMLLMFDR